MCKDSDFFLIVQWKSHCTRLGKHYRRLISSIEMEQRLSISVYPFSPLTSHCCMSAKILLLSEGLKTTDEGHSWEDRTVNGKSLCQAACQEKFLKHVVIFKRRAAWWYCKRLSTGPREAGSSPEAAANLTRKKGLQKCEQRSLGAGSMLGHCSSCYVQCN